MLLESLFLDGFSSPQSSILDDFFAAEISKEQIHGNRKSNTAGKGGENTAKNLHAMLFGLLILQIASKGIFVLDF